MNGYNMDQFFNWLSKPMKPEDIQTWYSAHNIIPELSELFKDYCFSLYHIITDTYLGDSHNGFNETKIGMTDKDKLKHFEWCWNKNIENFSKENVIFDFKKDDYDYFEMFFFEVFYDQENTMIKKELYNFLRQLFNRRRPISKSDLEMFTDVYKTLERSLQL